MFRWLRVKRLYHVSALPSTLHRGMLSDLAGPGVMGFSGGLENENSYTIKITMAMDMLRTKTPARVRAELAMFLVGYNLIRTVMFDAAKVSAVRLEQLSFKSALMRFGLWCAGLRHSTRIRMWLLGYQAMLSDLARDLNPDRPGRYEPRVVKRRPKPFPRMQQPRQVLREQLLRA
jgi:hypothetical protein